jgi:hypothetical protein
MSAMGTRDQVLHDLQALSEPEFAYIARLVEDLRSRPQNVPLPSFDPAVYGPLYREFSAHDRDLAEEGMADYARGLHSEEKG